MNNANLTFAQSELALLDQVLRHAGDSPIRGLVRLRQLLKRARPDSPVHLKAVEIGAADEALRLVSEQGIMPAGLADDEAAAFHHLKGVLAAAAVD